MRVLKLLTRLICLLPVIAHADNIAKPDISCDQFGLARIYVGLNTGDKAYYSSLEKLKSGARTKTESIDPDWIEELCEFLFDREYYLEKIDQNSKNSFILVELLADSGEHATLSTDGKYLYYNEAYSAKIDDKFLSAFNFGDTALEIQYGY